jgi:hypothetical protein
MSKRSAAENRYFDRLGASGVHCGLASLCDLMSMSGQVGSMSSRSKNFRMSSTRLSGTRITTVCSPRLPVPLTRPASFRLPPRGIAIVSHWFERAVALT